MQVHSVPSELHPEPCETIPALPDRRLRPYVLGYAGFRSGALTAVRHRVLPLNLTTLVIDFTGQSRLVTGPRSTALVYEHTAWQYGVSVGLTPAGVIGLLGLPTRELVGETVDLAEVLGRREVELVERLRGAPDWPSRFAILNERFTAWLAPEREPDPLVMHAWSRLQHSTDRLGIGALAGEFGISRRYLELRFQREIGLPPRTVSRIARFQHVVQRLHLGSSLPRTAAECGYADQPHLSRDVRAMAGVTPKELFAFLQYRQLAPQ